MVANYLFDSLRHDIFRVSDGRLYAALAQLSTDQANLDEQREGRRVKQLDQVELNFSYRAVAGDYYGIEAFDRLLETYVRELHRQCDDAHFIFPIGGLRCLENLTQLCRGRYLMLAADKGGCGLSQVTYSSAPRISFHGNCFSVQVNFHALMQYLQHTGGDSAAPPLQQGITTVALLGGIQLGGAQLGGAQLGGAQLGSAHFSALPETRQALDNYLGRYSPATLFNVYSYIRDTVGHCPPETFVALLIMTDWDPHIFNRIIGALLTKMAECSATTKQALVDGMPVIAENFYYMPGAIDTLSGIALFFQELKNYNQALGYYQQSINYYGEADHICYNQGLCRYYLGDAERAVERFERALQLNPGLDCARQWLDDLDTLSMPPAKQLH